MEGVRSGRSSCSAWHESRACRWRCTAWRRAVVLVSYPPTDTAFGVGFGEAWTAASVIKKIKAKDPMKGKAEDQYMKKRLVVDEGAQVYFEQLNLQCKVGLQIKTTGPRQLLVILMDALQTPPVIEKDKRQANPGAEMLWDGGFYRDADAHNQVAKYSLETVYSTSNPKLKELGRALRSEDDEAAMPLVRECASVLYDSSFADVVHDNSEIYEIAEFKHGTKSGANWVCARCESGGPHPDLSKWPAQLLRKVREKSKMLVDLITFKGQLLHYEPIGKTGAQTDGGWYLTKGELVEVVEYYVHTRQFRVRCLKLRNTPLAWISEECVQVTLNEHGMTEI